MKLITSQILLELEFEKRVITFPTLNPKVNMHWNVFSYKKNPRTFFQMVQAHRGNGWVYRYTCIDTDTRNNWVAWDNRYNIFNFMHNSMDNIYLDTSLSND